MKKLKIYIRRKTPLVSLDEGATYQGQMLIESREGSKGTWKPSGDENGIWTFATSESRDLKIKELVLSGAILV